MAMLDIRVSNILYSFKVRCRKSRRAIRPGPVTMSGCFSQSKGPYRREALRTPARSVPGHPLPFQTGQPAPMATAPTQM